MSSYLFKMFQWNKQVEEIGKPTFLKNIQSVMEKSSPLRK